MKKIYLNYFILLFMIVIINPLMLAQAPCTSLVYGASIPVYTGDEEIFNVTFGTLNNTSNCASVGPGPGSVNQLYSNYTGFVAAPAVFPGQTVNYSLLVGTCGGWYGVQSKIYIDYNQNGSFLDAGENVATIASSNNAANTGVITIPVNALLGYTRMRVVAVEGTVPGPANSYLWGETEDYCIQIKSPCEALVYGASVAALTGDEEIFNVTFGTLNNTSNCASVGPGAGSINQRYSNYTGFVAAPLVSLGQAVNYALTVGTCGGWYGVQSKIYIDYNQNGSFLDAGENVATIASSNNAANTGVIIIPANATPGITRMRVVAVEGAVPGPINGYTWGETEDYCINISAAVPCSGTPVAGTAVISASLGCPSIPISLNVNSAATGLGISYQWQTSSSALGPWTNVGTNATLYSTSAAVTSYYQMVTTCSGSGLTATTSVVSFSPFINNPCACSVYGASAASSIGDEEILNVTVGTLNNTSNCASVGPGPASVNQLYSNYTGFVAAPSICSGLVPFSITLGTCGGWYGVGMNIYIDCNQNGTFTDPGELVYANGSTINGVNTGFLNIPGNATPGITRMRVVAVEGAVPGPVNAYTWGETEDYCVSLLPSPTIIATGGSVACGSSIVITPSGALSYTYTSVGGGTVTGNTATFTPLSNANYTVSGTGANGCVGAVNNVSVSVLAASFMTITAINSTICPYSTTTFSALGGAITYTWSNSVNTNTSLVNSFAPLSSSVYSVIGTNSIGCASSATFALNAFATPTLSISPSYTTVCSMTNLSLSVTGALSYTWSNANTGSVSVFTPSATSQYSVLGADANGCKSSANAVVITNPSPVITISASSQTVCALTPVIANASGAITYTWSNGGNGATNTITPSSSSIYTITGTGTNGCIGSKTLALFANPLPTVVISPPSASICVGSQLVLSAGGAITYTWSTGSSISTETVMPSSSIIYSLSATNALGCIGNSTVSVIVNELPTVVVSPSTATICRNETINLTASGASTYTWMPGNIVSSSYSMMPQATGFYTLSGTSTVGCNNEVVFVIKVSACTGIQSFNIKNNVISIYPNPSSGLFTATFDFEGQKDITILNSLGSTIHQLITTANVELLDLSTFAKGIYFINVKSNTLTGSYKIIIE